MGEKERELDVVRRGCTPTLLPLLKSWIIFWQFVLTLVLSFGCGMDIFHTPQFMAASVISYLYNVVLSLGYSSLAFVKLGPSTQRYTLLYRD